MRNVATHNKRTMRQLVEMVNETEYGNFSKIKVEEQVAHFHFKEGPSFRAPDFLFQDHNL